jgi:hypothetical protein
MWKCTVIEWPKVIWSTSIQENDTGIEESRRRIKDIGEESVLSL